MSTFDYVAAAPILKAKFPQRSIYLGSGIYEWPEPNPVCSNKRHGHGRHTVARSACRHIKCVVEHIHEE